MRARSILILHEHLSARTHLGEDVVEVASALHARAIDFSYAHISSDAELETIDAGSVFGNDNADRDVFRRSQPLASIDPDSFAGLIICDHSESLARLGSDATFHDVVRAFVANDRPIVAVGHIAGALAGIEGSDDRSLLADRRVTFATRTEDTIAHHDASSIDVERAVRDAGAIVKNEEPGDEHVSVDAYLITAQNMRSANSATRTILAFLDPAAQARKRAS